MKKCQTCGRKPKNEIAKFCDECGGKVEEYAEEALPAKTIKNVKKRPFAYLAATLTLLFVSVFMTTSYVIANGNLKDQSSQINSLNKDLQKNTNELKALQDSLSKTEEGKKQLEQAKAQVEDQNKQLDARATTAESTASKAKSDLAKTQADLSTKQALLASTNDQLAKAQRGVAKFDQTESLFTKFSTSSANLTNYFYEGQKALGNNDMATANYYLSLIGPEIDNNKSLYNQINAIFNAIKSGNY